MTYPVHEMFYTFQGEGKFSGRAAFFVRLFGCPLHCSWCDAAGTWHKDYIPEHVPKLSAADIAQEAKMSRAQIVVITGGEPCIHDLKELVDALHAGGMQVHLETSGAFPLFKSGSRDVTAFDHVVLSPKWNQKPIEESLQLCHEIKIIVENENSISDWEKELGEHMQQRMVRLHPEWTQHENAQVLNAIVAAVKNHPSNYYAGWQLHKLYRCDDLDPRSKPLVPLGGNPELGY